jgi:hypothetical protein
LQTKQLNQIHQQTGATFQPGKRMSSERQINANRISGAKSHGAITPEGKLASSRNSLVHGLLSQVII